MPDSPPPPECANCGAPLSGRYCAACGQRHEPHIHSVAHFAAEGFESISHADSRLWRTLWYLLARPGFLTREFFAGRRMSYLPPFRLYLVISLLFFLVVGLPEGNAIRLDGDTGADRAAKMRAVASEQEQETGPASDALKLAAAALNEQARKESALVPGTTGAAGATGPGAQAALSERSEMLKFCDKFSSGNPVAQDFAARFHAACNRIVEDRGAELS